MQTDDLTQHEEDIAAEEFDHEEVREPQFGNWPELVGLLLTAALVWMSFAFRG